MTIRTFKYRLDPTKSQIRLLEETLDLCRWVYNKALETKKNGWEQEQKSIGKYDLIKMLSIWKSEKEELNQVYSQVLQNIPDRVCKAFDNFFRRIKTKEKSGFPRFKNGNNYKSFTYPQSGFELKKEGLLLSKIGLIKIKLHRKIKGGIKTLTVKKNKLGQWFAIFVCEVEEKKLPKNKKVIGLDMGLTHFLTDSKGRKIENPRFFRKDEKELKKYQSKMSKQQKSSKKWYKYIRKIQHIHNRIQNRRDNFAHQLSRKYVNKYGVIAVEKLEIKNMVENQKFKGMNKSINDVAWRQFLSFLSYKAENAGRKFVEVDPRGTSQRCSKCNNLIPKKLKDRIHDCSCGTILDRDHNSARKVLARGLSSLGFYKTLKALNLFRE